MKSIAMTLLLTFLLAPNDAIMAQSDHSADSVFARQTDDSPRSALTYYDYLLMHPTNCSYIPGDCDCDGVPITLADVIAMIGMYSGTVVPPCYVCHCPGPNHIPPRDDFAATADPNGDCIALTLVDVMWEIAAYRGYVIALGCVDCP